MTDRAATSAAAPVRRNHVRSRAARAGTIGNLREGGAHVLARVMGRPCAFRVPAGLLRTLVGEMADALLLASTRALPKTAVDKGYFFRYESVEEALKERGRLWYRAAFAQTISISPISRSAMLTLRSRPMAVPTGSSQVQAVPEELFPFRPIDNGSRSIMRRPPQIKRSI